MQESKQVLRTRRDISNALTSLMLERKFEDITVKDICEKAMITRATFYKYFEDKYHLISCVIEDMKNEIFTERLKDFTYTTPKELYMKIAELCIDYIEKNRTNFMTFFKNENNDKLRMLLLKSINDSIELVLSKQKDLVEYKIPIKILSKFFTGGFAYVGLYLLEEDKSRTKEEILSYLEIMLEGVSKAIAN